MFNLLFRSFLLFFISLSVNYVDAMELPKQGRVFGPVDKNESTCSICRKAFPQDWPGKLTLCKNNDKLNHTFCTECLYQWQKKKAYCPTCRTEISDEMHDYVICSYATLRNMLFKENVSAILEQCIQNPKKNKKIEEEFSKEYDNMSGVTGKLLDRAHKYEELFDRTEELTRATKAFQPKAENAHGHKTATKLFLGTAAIGAGLYLTYRYLKS